MTVRTRVLVELPHVAEHGVQGLHCVTAQLSGHGSSVHVRVAKVGWQVPPLDAGLSTGRERVEVPEPHETVHSDHTDHLPTAHGTGHAGAEQLTVFCEGVHREPLLTFRAVP